MPGNEEPAADKVPGADKVIEAIAEAEQTSGLSRPGGCHPAGAPGDCLPTDGPRLVPGVSLLTAWSLPQCALPGQDDRAALFLRVAAPYPVGLPCIERVVQARLTDCARPAYRLRAGNFMVRCSSRSRQRKKHLWIGGTAFGQLPPGANWGFRANCLRMFRRCLGCLWHSRYLPADGVLTAARHVAVYTWLAGESSRPG